MPVSPADFEFYSRMTGQPIPNTPAGRMAIAPQVYSMRRSPLSKVGDFISGVGQTAALAGGAVAGGLLLSQLAGKRGESTSKENEADAFIKDLQAQGAKEREATATARALQAKDAEVYRGMVKDAGDKIISELAAEGQPASPAAEIPSGSQGFKPGPITSSSVDPSAYDDPDVLVEVTPEERAKAKAFLANRISHQSAVPQADVNVANESTAAQRASVSSPPDPTPVVRQQPSSGQIVSDVSNVAKLDRASMIREARAFLTEAKAMNRMIRERDQTGYKGDRPIPKSHPGGSKRDLDAGIHAGTYIGMADDMNDPARGGLDASPELMASMLQRGNFLGAQPSQPASSTAMPSNRELMSEMLERGNVLPDATEQMSRGGKSYVPTPETVGPFVSNKGREIGALLQKAQAPAAEPKVDQKRMRAEEQARKSVGLGSPFFQDVVNKLMGNM